MELSSAHLNPQTPAHRRQAGGPKPKGPTHLPRSQPAEASASLAYFSMECNLRAMDKQVSGLRQDVCTLQQNQKNNQQIMEELNTLTEQLNARLQKLEEGSKPTAPYSLWSTPAPFTCLEPRPPGWATYPSDPEYSPVCLSPLSSDDSSPTP